MTIDNNTILHYKPIYSTMQGKNIQEGGIGGGGSKNRKTATKCAKNPKTVSKVVENRNRNVCVALKSYMKGMSYKATEKP